MALSTREVLLVLRARDEASRSVYHVGSALKRLGSDAVAAQAEMVADQRRTLQKLQVELGDVNHAYSRTSAQALESHRREMRAIEQQTLALRRQEAEIREVAATQARESRSLRASEKITAEQYRKASEQRQLLMRKQLAAIREQKFALEGQAQASKRLYQEQIEQYRKLHIAQVEQIRQQRLIAHEQLRDHESRMRQLETERARMRAQGQALMGIGSAAVATGVGMTLMGAEGIRALAGMVKANLDYQTSARRTLTQVDQTGVKLKQIENIGKEVGKTVPVAFDQIQPALYDIFSSIDTNLTGARTLLKQFARDAVGGNADMAVATKANLAIMNAYGISVEHVSKVSDFMFQLVRKGVGTYSDFASTVGLAVPSAVRLGVSLDELGGTLAFMTRNGLSASRAATSAARAFDALSNPRTASNLKKMGVDIVDAKGNLKDFPTILDMMLKKMKGLSSFQRSKFLKDAFYGSGGTIQALRFFNLVFKHMDQFKKRVGEMSHDSGVAQKAFTQMAKGPQAQLQELENDWKILRIELGQKLLPIALTIVHTVDEWIKAFDRLSPSQQKTIAVIAAMVAALLTIGGALTIAMGGIAIFVGAIKNLGLTGAEAANKLGRMAGGLTLMASGMVMAYNATDNTTKAIGIFTSAMGGAVAGSAFGPFGAAIGGVVGALSGFIASMHNAKKAVEESHADYSKLVDTYDQLTGATTAATRAAVLDQLQRSGALKNLQAYGINTRTAINAILGEADARKVVSSAIRNQTSYYRSLKDQIKSLQAQQDKAGADLAGSGARAGGRMTQEMRDRQALIDRLKKQAAAEKNVLDAVREGIPDARKAHKEALDRAFAVQDLTGKLNALPKEKRTRIIADGVYPTVKGIAKVAKQYKLTPKQIKIVIGATGVATTLKEVKKVEKGLKDVKEVKGDITPYLNSIRAGGHSAAGEAREIGQTALKNLQDGPKNAKADLSKYQQTLKAGITLARGIASTGGHNVGTDLSAGIVEGFSGTGSTLATEAAAAVRQAIAAARAAAKSKSPSRKMWEVGRDMARGGALGIHDNADLMATQAYRMAEDTLSKAAKGAEKKGKGLRHWLQTISKKNIVPRYKETLKDLDKAREKLKQIKQAQDQYSQSVKQGVTEFGSLSSISFTDVFGNENAPDLPSIQAGLASKLATIRQYGSLLRKLTKAGYSNAIVRQVAQMGPEAGVPYAQALLDATPAEVKQINKMSSQINQEATRIAKQQGRQMYGAGVQAAQGLIDGLESKQKALERAARRMGKAIVKELRKILQMHSPSRAAQAIGFNFGDTFASSLRDKVKDVTGAAGELAHATNMTLDKASAKQPPYFGPPPPPGAGGGGTTHTHYNDWKVYAGDQDPTALARKLAWEYETRFKK